MDEQVISQAFNTREFRDALGAFASGITVVTTQGAEHAYGLTASAFTSVSLDPPLVLVCVTSGTRGSESIEQNRVFAVNILSDEQSRSRAISHRAIDRAAGRPSRKSRTGRRSPARQFSRASGPYLDCRLAASYVAGDHVIFIGEVLALGVNPDVKPLVFHGQYRYLGEP